MDITQNINLLLLSITNLLIAVWGRVRYLLPLHTSNTTPLSAAFDLELESPETQTYPQAPLTISHISQNPEDQPLHSDTIALEMFQPPLQPLHPSHTPPPSPAIGLESQLPETQAQPSLTLNQVISQTTETQPLHFTDINTEILLQAAQTQAPQPHSVMEIELQLVPPAQQTPSPAINPQQINMVILKQNTLEWPNIIVAFCFEAAIQIALQYETTQHYKLPISFYLRSFSILLTFASLFVSQLISRKFPDISKVLEKVAIFLAAIAFFTAIATPLAPTLN